MATDDTSTPSEQCPAVYRPRRPAETVLYQVVAQHLETYLYLARQGDLDFDAVPAQVGFLSISSWRESALRISIIPRCSLTQSRRSRDFSWRLTTSRAVPNSAASS